jgi:hypothetical protein
MRTLRFAVAAILLTVPAWARQVTVTLLATTDLHGNIYPLDYFTGQPSPRGLAKIATLIQSVRRETPTRCSSIAATPYKARPLNPSIRAMSAAAGFRWVLHSPASRSATTP